MANLQTDSSSEVSRPPAFKTPSMNAPECFDGTHPFKVRSFIQSCQFIFHNFPSNLSQDRKKVLYATSFLIVRGAKWIEPYLSNLTNQEPIYLLNSWQLFESQLFTSFGDSNEVRRAEAELDALIMKESALNGTFKSLILPREKTSYWVLTLFNNLNPSIVWRQGLITFNSDHKDYHDPSDSFSNDFSSSKACAALVDYSRTPSFPSSVHIPSLNSHTSLLSSRDEVSKEIQDVGEDNSVSSLHLFFGNMDLPSSSYQDSLEELWDEEEEPEEVETVIKVVPSSYHRYLDVFSKVKAENPPPHHIELEGSLPPFGVIYSLSNKESDTLRTYISENLKKVLIQPSSSETQAPVFFVKKKYVGLHLCVDYCKLNTFTRKNKYRVPSMKWLLTVFNGSSIFSKIDLNGACKLLRIKDGDENLTAFRTKYGSYEYLVSPMLLLLFKILSVSL
ncbi:hypothetical protein O181_019707 [Austropuccinia psidii MF-1]|uniref:Reverse transcriptase domain-containing protein n=1 Tax=Austropuccinia psidii MF-1 TaxID=1389203 RepID=A0A9Q3CA97_9BASI|nr:hypothetical protein [Austropuccinia psidii MF-1]